MNIPEQTLVRTIVAGDGEAFLEKDPLTAEQMEAINVVLLGAISSRSQRDLLRSLEGRGTPILDARYVIDYVTAERQPNFEDYAARPSPSEKVRK